MRSFSPPKADTKIIMRKTDPGAALSMTVQLLRQKLEEDVVYWSGE